jgi:transcriptional regulator with XRE-family HTH domain
MTTFNDALIANFRAERARAGVQQEELAERMRGLGYKWKRQTVSELERGERRLLAEELIGIAMALKIPASRLLDPFDAHMKASQA